MKKLIVKDDICISCGACIQLDDEHFDFSPNGTSTVISQENLESENLAMAIDSCPVAAISIVESDAEDNACGCGEDCHCKETNPDGQCHCGEENATCNCESCHHECN